MSIDLFVPEIWSARLQRHIDANRAYGDYVNDNWEGEIRDKGDTVRIQKAGRPEIRNYDKYRTSEPEQPRGTTQSLTIDRDKTFYFSLDDLDRIQVNARLMDEYTRGAGIEMAKTVDGDISARMVLGAGVALGADNDPVTVRAGGDFVSFYDFIVGAAEQLDENDAPEESRWIVIPPSLVAMARRDDHFIPAGDQRQVTGVIGEVAGFEIRKTTRVPRSAGSGGSPVANRKVIFGCGNYATTFANQLVAVEAERLQGGRFEDALKGRNAFGAKVIEPVTLGCAHVATR